MSRILERIAGPACALLLLPLLACPGEELTVGRLTRQLSAICMVEVIKDGVSLGVKDVEKDYLPNVVNCESGDLDTEALKTQAVTARTYVYYKLVNGVTKITSGTSVQVYDCARKNLLAQKHYDAVNATAGQILTYMGNPIWPCFVAGASPTNPPCIPKTGVGADSCCTYNQGKSGSQITQSPCGFVDPTNYKNRGCVCQNGAHCFSLLGQTYVQILKGAFGDDIQFVTATGSCVSPSDAGAAKKDSQPPAKKDGAATRESGVAARESGAVDSPGTVGDGASPGAGGENTGGCSCTLGAGVPPGTPQLLLLLGLFMAAWRARRRCWIADRSGRALFIIGAAFAVLGAACAGDGPEVQQPDQGTSQADSWKPPAPDSGIVDAVAGRDSGTAKDRGPQMKESGLKPDAPQPKPDAFAGKPNVWIVGDSLAVGAGTPAQSMMTKYGVTVRAKVGATISNRYPEVVNAYQAKADAIVIQAGINDVGGGTANVSQLTYDIGRTLDATKGTRCVYWVTSQTKYTKGYLALNKSAPTLNQIIRAEVTKRSLWAHVIEFQPYIDQHPELNASDGLHLTTTGYQKLATLYHDALKGCFGF